MKTTNPMRNAEAKRFINAVSSLVCQLGPAASGAGQIRDAVTEYSMTVSKDWVVPFVTVSATKAGALKVQIFESPIHFDYSGSEKLTGIEVAQAWIKLFYLDVAQTQFDDSVTDANLDYRPIMERILQMPSVARESALGECVFERTIVFTRNELMDPAAVARKQATIKTFCHLWPYAMRSILAKLVREAGTRHLKICVASNIAVPQSESHFWAKVGPQLGLIEQHFAAMIADAQKASKHVKANLTRKNQADYEAKRLAAEEDSAPDQTKVTSAEFAADVDSLLGEFGL